MAIKKPIPITFNLDSRQSVQSVCAVIHIDDKNTETLDLSLMQGGEHIAISPNSTVTARFVRVKNNTLISDDIACTVQENGNIYIPIDNAAAHMLVGEIKIEVNIVDENDILTMQFPLVIRVNNTILADAEICSISKGTIPELIEKAQETADNAQETADNAQQAADNAQAAANSAQQTANNAMAELDDKQDTLTAGENITISNNNVISAEAGGVTDYEELENKPQINGYTLSGDKTASDLKLQKQLRYRAYGINSIAVDNFFNLDKNVYLGKEIFLKSKKDAFDLGVQPHVFRDYTGHMAALLAYRYDFNIINSAFAYCGGFSFTKNNLTNSPTFISDLKIDRIRIYHFFSPASAVEESKPLLRYVVGTDSTSNGVRIFAQIAQAVLQQNQSYSISYPSDWVELTGGGAQIVSGVVNSNGTITFTDSEGNSFTTSGESVIGADGFSPSATVQQTASGATITVTDKNGTTTANISNGQDGNDYVLTTQDKDDIADIVLNELPTTEGVLYGNQSN